MKIVEKVKKMLKSDFISGHQLGVQLEEKWSRWLGNWVLDLGRWCQFQTITKQAALNASASNPIYFYFALVVRQQQQQWEVLEI